MTKNMPTFENVEKVAEACKEDPTKTLVVWKNKVFDVSAFLVIHPGG